MTLALTPAGSVSGRVVSARDGRPVPQVRVRARESTASGDGEDAFAVSDASGSFSLEGLYPGRFDLVASAERWHGAQPVRVDVPLGAQVKNVMVRVEEAVAIRGSFGIRGEQSPCGQGSLALFADGQANMEPGPLAAQPQRPAYLARVRHDGEVVVEGVTPGRYRTQADCFNYLLHDGPEFIDARRRRCRGPAMDLSGGAERARHRAGYVG